MTAVLATGPGLLPWLARDGVLDQDDVVRRLAVLLAACVRDGCIDPTDDLTAMDLAAHLGAHTPAGRLPAGMREALQAAERRWTTAISAGDYSSPGEPDPDQDPDWLEALREMRLNPETGPLTFVDYLDSRDHDDPDVQAFATRAAFSLADEPKFPDPAPSLASVLIWLDVEGDAPPEWYAAARSSWEAYRAEVVATEFEWKDSA